jgi:hypothetical protein
MVRMSASDPKRTLTADATRSFGVLALVQFEACVCSHKIHWARPQAELVSIQKSGRLNDWGEPQCTLKEVTPIRIF